MSFFRNLFGDHSEDHSEDFSGNYSSSELDDKLNELRHEAQDAKHGKDTHKLKKLSSSIQDDLWRIKEKIKKAQSDVAFEKRKLESAIQQLQKLENDVYRRNEQMAREYDMKIRELNQLQTEKNRRLRELFDRLKSYFFELGNRRIRGVSWKTDDRKAFSINDIPIDNYKLRR